MPGPSKADDLRFGAPRSSVDIEEIKDSGVPKKTKANTSWTTSIWREWAIHRSRNLLDDDAAHKLLPDVVRMETDAMAHWLQRFIFGYASNFSINFNFG